MLGGIWGRDSAMFASLLLLLMCAIGLPRGISAADIHHPSTSNTVSAPIIALGASAACAGTACSLSRRALQDADDDDDDDDDGPRAPPNPVLAATPLTTANADGTLGGTAGTLTVVRTAPELYAALAEGSRHIDLRGHVDLTSLSIDDAVEWSEPLLPEVRAETVTIAVRHPTVTAACCHSCPSLSQAAADNCPENNFPSSLNCTSCSWTSCMHTASVARDVLDRISAFNSRHSVVR